MKTEQEHRDRRRELAETMVERIVEFFELRKDRSMDEAVSWLTAYISAIWGAGCKAGRDSAIQQFAPDEVKRIATKYGDL